MRAGRADRGVWLEDAGLTRLSWHSGLHADSSVADARIVATPRCPMRSGRDDPHRASGDALLAQRSNLTLAAIALLATGAFGGLSVGVPLVYAQLTIRELAGEELGVSLIPAIALVYGLMSLVGAVGLWRARGWATGFVVVSQGVVALALLAVYAGNPDWSILIVAAIAGGAALCALANARLASRA